MYVDTRQGMVERLDDPAGLPHGDTLPRHNIVRIHIINELLKKK